MDCGLGESGHPSVTEMWIIEKLLDIERRLAAIDGRREEG
jgi:hypothetical protein